MSNVKISRQYSIKRDGFFTIKYGTTDKHNPTVIYMRCKSKIKPYVDKKNYRDDVAKIKRSLSSAIKNELNSMSDIIDVNRYLFDIELTSDTLSYNKISRLNINLYLCPLDIKPIEEYETCMCELVNNIEVRTNGIINNNCLTFNL